jgi:hypothetical protein
MGEACSIDVNYEKCINLLGKAEGEDVSERRCR